jgi:hypothetical protein
MVNYMKHTGKFVAKHKGDPFYGNVTVATGAGQRWYTLKSDSSSITTDYASIDWDDFYVNNNKCKWRNNSLCF